MFMFFIVSMWLGVLAGVGFTLALLWMSNPTEFEGFILMVTWEWGLIKREAIIGCSIHGGHSAEYVTYKQWVEAEQVRHSGEDLYMFISNWTGNWCWRWQTPPDDDCDGDVDETDDGCFCDN